MSQTPRSTAAVAGRPLHPLFAIMPIACFSGTLLTDIAYLLTDDMQWANFSAWLLTAGLVAAVFAVIAGATDFLGDRRIRALRPAWIHAVGNGVALVLAIVNAFVHSRDAYTSVAPTGVILSALVVAILAVTGWNGAALVHRHGVGVRLEGER